MHSHALENERFPESIEALSNDTHWKTYQICFIAGRDTPLVIADHHVVNNNTMKPPFPDKMEIAMFGEYFCKTKGLCHRPSMLF